MEAQIDVLPGVSGHADKSGLLAWLGGFETKPKMVFVNHGDPDAADSFTATLNDELGYKAFAPYSGACFDLLRGELERVTEPVAVAPKTKAPAANRAFGALVAAAERLLRICRGMEGRANKMLNGYTRKIDEISDDMEK